MQLVFDCPQGTEDGASPASASGGLDRCPLGSSVETARRSRGRLEEMQNKHLPPPTEPCRLALRFLCVSGVVSHDVAQQIQMNPNIKFKYISHIAIKFAVNLSAAAK